MGGHHLAPAALKMVLMIMVLSSPRRASTFSSLPPSLSGDLIGFYFKSQPSPKPIYRKNRIVLGRNPQDISYEHFMNANEVHTPLPLISPPDSIAQIIPNLIASQCPLRGYPSGYADTLNDTRRMILEYEVALWVQIAPMSTDGSLPSPPPDSNHPSVKYCDLFPLRFYPIVEGEEEEGIHFAHDDHFSNLTYTLNGYSRRLLNGTIETIFDPPTQETETEVCQDSTATTATWVQRSQSVEHLWFHQWDDFSIPERQYDEVIDRITTRAAEYLSQNKTVVISCFSGRGRYAHALS